MPIDYSQRRRLCRHHPQRQTYHRHPWQHDRRQILRPQRAGPALAYTTEGLLKCHRAAHRAAVARQAQRTRLAIPTPDVGLHRTAKGSSNVPQHRTQVGGIVSSRSAAARASASPRHALGERAHPKHFIELGPVFRTSDDGVLVLGYADE
jgi:hypothetical protein